MSDMAWERVEHTQVPPPPAELISRMESGSRTFSQFLGARRQRSRADSLSEAMKMQMPFASLQPRVQQQQFFPTVQPMAQVNMQPGQQFFPQQKFGTKMPSVKDMKLTIERFYWKERIQRTWSWI